MVPAARPLTRPELVTVAILLFDDVHVPFVEGVTFAVWPIHTSEGPPRTGVPGTEFIVTFADAEDIQLLTFVMVKLYVLLTGKPVTV